VRESERIEMIEMINKEDENSKDEKHLTQTIGNLTFHVLYCCDRKGSLFLLPLRRAFVETKRSGTIGPSINSEIIRFLSPVDFNRCATPSLLLNPSLPSAAQMQLHHVSLSFVNGPNAIAIRLSLSSTVQMERCQA
jgi:hypothetical protein